MTVLLLATQQPLWLQTFLRRRAVFRVGVSIRLLSNDHVVQTPIAIVGGGPTALLLSTLLSSYQVPSVLIEAQSVEERCKHPQAHFLNTRSMEILRQLPRVHRNVKELMAPVEQWKHFQFGANMLPETALARINHPVDRPLLANVDANGILVEETNSEEELQQSTQSSRPLSACTVGHLAQHTFCKILYEAAKEEALSNTQLHYSTRVTQLNTTNNDKFEIQTDSNLTVQAPICIAADGAHSFCRNHWQIHQVGQVGIQHLLNIHVKTCPEWARSYLHDQGSNFAMLYSTFHPNVVAMIVCHSVGEYVFQVPFFPPYQSLEDYSPERVEQMVYDAMGIDNDDTIHKKNAQIDVVSVKAWNMSSLIAERYSHTAGGCVGYLVGDAAHVFPPAGGLGMNTGMQDVYSLAWKLAWAFHQGHLSSSERSKSDKAQSLLKRIGAAYQDERRPVAQANAALSVRNYNRVLEITKACYMNDQHPTLLIQTLEASSALVPFGARREIFQRLYATATWSLSPLRDAQHFYTKHLRQNIRRILARGGGLPLLFPRAELGFGYTKEMVGKSHDSPREEDSMGFQPTIRVGHLFPHVEATIIMSPDPIENYFPGLKPLGCNETTTSEGTTCISLSDLPAQVSRDMKPCFVLLCVSTTGGASLDLYHETAGSLSETLGMAVEAVEVLSSSSMALATITEPSQNLVLQEVAYPVDESLLDAFAGSLWLIRPDGHVAGGLMKDDLAVKERPRRLEETLLQYAHQALFGRT